MADEPASDDAAPEPAPTAPAARRTWLFANRNLKLIAGCGALCAIIAVDVYFMRRGGAPPLAVIAANSHAAAPSSAPAAPVSSAVPKASASAVAVDPAEGDAFGSDDGEPASSRSAAAAPKHFATVQQAAIESCTTSSVAGLSRQIIAQARCMKPSSFAPLPKRANLIVESEVFPYLQLEARNQLAKALDARPKQKMTINSALRTVAQQYLVWRWSATRRCGVPLATPPGQSNHELGFALDIAEASAWRTALEAQNFKWLGASDRVHFDYVAPAGSGASAMDVLAFQTLWNRNHPTDKLKEDGRYSPAVEKRLKLAPPDGFALGASCGKR